MQWNVLGNYLSFSVLWKISRKKVFENEFNFLDRYGVSDVLFLLGPVLISSVFQGIYTFHKVGINWHKVVYNIFTSFLFIVRFIATSSFLFLILATWVFSHFLDQFCHILIALIFQRVWLIFSYGASAFYFIDLCYYLCYFLS